MLHKYFVLISCTFFLFLTTGCKQTEATTYDIVIKNGNVVDLATGAIATKDMLIRDGKVIKITAPNSQHNGSATSTIDATDKYILPGFWDNHVHFRGGDSLVLANKKFLSLFIANGITTVRDAGGDLTPNVLQWRESIADGKLTGPTIYTSGPKIDGPNGTWAGSLAVRNKNDITAALDSLESIPVDFVKLYDSRISGEDFLNTLRETEKRNLITSGHMPFTVMLDETIAAGIDAVEHLYYVMKGCSEDEKTITQSLIQKEIGFWDAMPLLMRSYNDSVAQTTFTRLKQNNVFVVPTLQIGETLSYLDETDHSTDAYLKYINDGIITTYEGRIQRALKASPEQRIARKELQAFFGKLTKSLHDAGVQLLAGSDSGAFNSYTYPGISLHQELEQLVASGITPLEALKTSAYNGAKFLKKDADYGTLQAGKVADLVILDQNPLIAITNTRKIAYVIKNNVVHNKKDLQKLLDAIAN